MHAALIPVRSIGGSKSRLAGILDESRRCALALAMLEDMIVALEEAASVDRTIVVSGDPTLLRHAAAVGAEIIDEGAARGLNAAVTMAARTLQKEGVGSLLTIPGDVPLITPVEIDGAFSVDAARYPVVLIPSIAATGTNGLLTNPPTVIEPMFEGGSLAAHRRACAEAGVAALLLGLEGFAIDVDTPDDLALLAASAGRTADLVRSWQLTGENRC